MTHNEDWLMILGDDDVLDENFVAEFYLHLDEIKQLQINVVRYATIVIDEHGQKVSKVYTHPKFEKSTNFLMRKLEGGTRSSLSEFIFKREVLEKIKFKNLPLAWHSDYLAVLECSNFDNIYTINESIVSFRSSGLNITSKTDDLTLKNLATFKYYYYLLNEKSIFFSKKQKETLYFTLEKTFLDNKKNINFWLLLTKLYIVNFKIKKYLNFILKAFKSVIYKNSND